MEVKQFHDRIYGRFKDQLFVFEPTWDSFRPIEGIGWNGRQIVPIEAYKQNVFDPWYGFGSREMKDLCRTLIEETELSKAEDVRDPLHLWRWYREQHIVWWRDRPCVFTSSCVPRDAASWKAYLHYLDVRAKTLRRPFRGRATKRLLPK